MCHFHVRTTPRILPLLKVIPAANRLRGRRVLDSVWLRHTVAFNSGQGKSLLFIVSTLKLTIPAVRPPAAKSHPA